MNVVSSYFPEKDFYVEKCINKPGFVTVRFFENVKEKTTGLYDELSKEYVYDEYSLTLPYYPEIENDISKNIESFINQAKSIENNNSFQNLKNKIKQLEEEKNDLQKQTTDIQLALCDVYEQILSVAKG